MKKQDSLNPTKSISVAFLLGFIAIAGLLTYVTTITKNGSFDTRTKAALVAPDLSCTGIGITCMTATECQSMHRFTIGKLNCVGTLVCCSSTPPATSTPVLKPYIITPKAADTWERFKTYQISWYENMAATSTGLSLYTRSGTTDTYIGPIAYHVSNVVGTNTYSWTIPVRGDPGTSPPDGNNIIVSVEQYDANGNRIIDAKSTPFTVVTSLPQH
jgi:hypothetical protein